MERGIGSGRLPARIHTGDCWDTGNRCTPATPEQIRQLLAEGVPACPHCRPDTALGMLEWDAHRQGEGTALPRV
ncbi:DUF6233 domain-containing protein [Streptomyces sp. NBC_01443]|nr:DUF6233 domain-containing protein [Streptomyces sp. NBC_01443]MCX4633149.1 DUF6233 domain-containing protein [Streptomyces sp. NBC_01443]